MNIEHLKYFLTVARTKSIRKAGEELFISSQNLSFIIKGLEKELGIRLFVRSNKGVHLTQEGMEFFPYAQQVVQQYSLYWEKRKRQTSSNILTLYTTMVLSDAVSVLQSRSLSQQYYLSVQKRSADELYHMMEHNYPGIFFVPVIDGAIGDHLINNLKSDYQTCTISRDETSVSVLHKNHELLQSPETLIANMQNWTHIINSNDFGFSPNRFISVDNPEIYKQMMRENGFIFVTRPSLAPFYFFEDEWVIVPNKIARTVEYVLFYQQAEDNNREYAREELMRRLKYKFKSG